MAYDVEKKDIPKEIVTKPVIHGVRMRQKKSITKVNDNNILNQVR